MRKRYLTMLTTTALLTAVASVGQPQTVDPSTGMSATSPATTAEDQPRSSTTTSATTSGTTSSGTTTSSAGTSTPSSGTTTTSSSDTMTPSSSATPSTPGTLGGTASSGTTYDSPSAAGNTAGSSRLQGQDATFVQRALEMGRLEVAQAQAALQSATRSDTKTAARMLIEDHQRANQQLEQLASRKGWSLPSESQSAESDQARASSSAGSFDDDRFMADQIRAHRDAISLFRAQSSGGSDPELRQFASDQLPHLEHHLEMLQSERTQK